ncbi:cell division protein FtsW [Rhodoligotrophos appendicifer]|uniref:putative lipid II flippase FtsW n=1 Tax=Rhodoligotrophos appendicifer TaxID=987056 RepID=UPI0011872B14|nr:putative lipid II flippase FtsW [Rhodoligotrophos appendicifer]
MSLISRADRGLVANWWFTVDRLLLTALLMLMVIGAMLSMAASPPVAQRLDVDAFYFFRRHVIFLVPAIILLIGASFMTPQWARRVALVMFIGGLAMMALTLVIGPEVKGARRWLEIGPFSIQPSEFVKPAFVILSAWFLSESARKRSALGYLLATGMLATVAGLLVLQPDYGQTILITAVWGVMLFLTGLSWFWIAGIGVLAGAGGVFAYMTGDHFASRIDRFMNRDAGDTFQVDRAVDAFAHGGLYGVGPGSGTVKGIIPDAHSDFVFSVAGEEFGFIVCLGILLLFAFIVVRGLKHSLHAQDPFCTLATAGLVSIFGFQSFINMGVNVSLLPAKGMTLPLVSYGGSSLLAMGLGMGLMVALARRTPMGHMPNQGSVPVGMTALGRT